MKVICNWCGTSNSEWRTENYLVENEGWVWGRYVGIFCSQKCRYEYEQANSEKIERLKEEEDRELERQEEANRKWKERQEKEAEKKASRWRDYQESVKDFIERYLTRAVDDFQNNPFNDKLFEESTFWLILNPKFADKIENHNSAQRKKHKRWIFKFEKNEVIKIVVISIFEIHFYRKDEKNEVGHWHLEPGVHIQIQSLIDRLLEINKSSVGRNETRDIKNGEKRENISAQKNKESEGQLSHEQIVSKHEKDNSKVNSSENLKNKNEKLTIYYANKDVVDEERIRTFFNKISIDKRIDILEKSIANPKKISNFINEFKHIFKGKTYNDFTWILYLDGTVFGKGDEGFAIIADQNNDLYFLLSKTGIKPDIYLIASNRKSTAIQNIKRIKQIQPFKDGKYKIMYLLGDDKKRSVLLENNYEGFLREIKGIKLFDHVNFFVEVFGNQ
jgi:hypothetical protein